MDADLARLNVVIDARMDRLEEKLGKMNRAVYGAARKAERDFNKVNLSKAVQDQIDGLSRRTALGTTALTAFGAGGMAAAGGIAALTLAMQGMRSALQFADDLDADATKIGVTAEALQELRFAAAESDITVEELDKGLQGLNATLGAYKTGVGDAKVKKAFEALGLTRKDLEGVRNASDFLPILADKIAKLQSTAARVKIAKALGAEELVPMLEKGSAAMTEQTARARRLGIVMSDELAAKAADANRELEVMGDIISSNLKISFANLGVWIVETTKKMDPLISKLREWVAAAQDAFASPEFEGRFPALAGSKIGMRTAYEYDQARKRAAARGEYLPTPAEIAADSRRGPQSRGRRRVTPAPQPPSERTYPYVGGGGGGGRSGGSARDDAERKRKAEEEQAERRYILDLEGRIAAAERDNDTARIARLQDELELFRLIARYRDAGYDSNAARDLAVDRVRVERETKDDRQARDTFSDNVVVVDQNADLEQPLEPKSVRGHALLSKEEEEAARQQWADVIGGGLRAAIYGGAEGMAEYFAQTLTEALIDDLSSQLAGMLRDLVGGQGGAAGGGGGGLLGQFLGGLFGGGGFGGIGGFGGGLGGILNTDGRAVGILNSGGGKFAGKFAQGGLIPNGQWGVVNDQGEEAVRWTPGGIQVKPNSSLRALQIGEVSRPKAAGGGALSVAVSINLKGANGDETIGRIAREEAARGVAFGLKQYGRGAAGRDMNMALLGTPG